MHKKRSNRTWNLEMPIQLLHIEKNKIWNNIIILSNLQPDNSIHVTSPDNGRVPLILNKADYYSKVKAILSDGYKIQSPSN